MLGISNIISLIHVCGDLKKDWYLRELKLFRRIWIGKENSTVIYKQTMEGSITILYMLQLIEIQRWKINMTPYSI